MIVKYKKRNNLIHIASKYPTGSLTPYAIGMASVNDVFINHKHDKIFFCVLCSIEAGVQNNGSLGWNIIFFPTVWIITWCVS